MNPKVLFLLYGVFAVGSSYQLKAQIISTLVGDINQGKDLLENGSGRISFAASPETKQNSDVSRKNTTENAAGRSPTEEGDNENGQKGSRLVYYCRFSDKGLKNFIC